MLVVLPAPLPWLQDDAFAAASPTGPRTFEGRELAIRPRRLSPPPAIAGELSPRCRVRL